MMVYGNGMGTGGWVLMLLSTVALWALLIAAIVLVVRTLWAPQSPPGGAAAEDVLAERFARGEIDSDEYHQRLQALRAARH
jgi:putative membrane protein